MSSDDSQQAGEAPATAGRSRLGPQRWRRGALPVPLPCPVPGRACCLPSSSSSSSLPQYSTQVMSRNAACCSCPPKAQAGTCGGTNMAYSRVCTSSTRLPGPRILIENPILPPTPSPLSRASPPCPQTHPQGPEASPSSPPHHAPPTTESSGRSSSSQEPNEPLPRPRSLVPRDA